MARLWLWPSAITLSALGMFAVSVAEVAPALRHVIAFWFLLVCPGMAAVRLLRIREPVVEWTLAVALSLALDLLLAAMMVYSGRWSPVSGVLLLVAFSIGCVLPQFAWAARGSDQVTAPTAPTELIPVGDLPARSFLPELRRGRASAVARLLLVPVIVLSGLVVAAPVDAPATTPFSGAPGTADATLRLVMDEPFLDNSQGWPDDPQSTAWHADGTYRLLARRIGQFVAVGAPLPQTLGDVVLTGVFRKVGGPPGGGYGLIVRDAGPGPRDGLNQGGRYYVFEANDRGEVGIWRREEDNWATLLTWTRSPAVAPGGATNELTVAAIGRSLTFHVNGVEVARREDELLARGAVGVFAGGDLNDVVLEHFTVRVPLSGGDNSAATTMPSQAGSSAGTAIASIALGPPATRLSLVVIFLLNALLIVKEMMRAYGGLRAWVWMRRLDLAIAPLLIVFVFVVGLRFARLFRLL